MLLAVGVQPNIEDLGLETLGVELDRGFIKTDAACRTNVFGLYAIGDVAEPAVSGAQGQPRRRALR